MQHPIYGSADKYWGHEVGDLNKADGLDLN